MGLDGDDEGDQIAWRYHTKKGPAHGFLKGAGWSLCSMALWMSDQDRVDNERRLCGLCVNVAKARKLKVVKCAVKGCNNRHGLKATKGTITGTDEVVDFLACSDCWTAIMAAGWDALLAKIAAEEKADSEA